MTANVALTDSFDQWRVKTNEVVVMTQTDGMSNFVKVLDTTNSTINTTGSIITAGGVGIAKSVNIGEDLKVWGDITCVGDTTISGNLVFGDENTDQVTFDADINSSLVPNVNNAFNIGNTKMIWANTYTGHLGVTQKSDSGKAALTITSEDVDKEAVRITASQSTANVYHINAHSLTTGTGITVLADALTTGSALAINSNAPAGTRNLFEITNDNALAVGTTALSIQSDAGRGIFIDSNLPAGGPSLEIDSEHVGTNAISINSDPMTTGYVIDITADNLTTGSALKIDSDSDSTSTRNIASIIQNHVDASGSTALYLQNDNATADALKIQGRSSMSTSAGTITQTLVAKATIANGATEWLFQVPIASWTAGEVTLKLNAGTNEVEFRKYHFCEKIDGGAGVDFSLYGGLGHNIAITDNQVFEMTNGSGASGTTHIGMKIVNTDGVSIIAKVTATLYSA